MLVAVFLLFADEIRTANLRRGFREGSAICEFEEIRLVEQDAVLAAPRALLDTLEGQLGVEVDDGLLSGMNLDAAWLPRCSAGVVWLAHSRIRWLSAKSPVVFGPSTAGTPLSTDTERAGVFEADRQIPAKTEVTAAGTALVVALLSVLTGGFVVLPIFGSVDIAVGLAVPLGLCLGLPAAIGVGTGVALSAVVESTLSWWILLDAAVYGAAGALAFHLWRVMPGPTTERPAGIRSPGRWLGFVAVTAVVATIAASALAWGAVVGWASPFHAVALAEWTLLLRSTLVVGPPILLAVSVFEEVTISEGDQRRLTTRSGAFWGGIVVPVLWFLVGSASSIFLASRQLEIIGGALALSVIAVTYLPRQRDEADSQPAQQPTPTDA